MRCDIITIFPDVVEAYLDASILGRARAAGALRLAAHDLRDYTDDRHHKVDDTPYGGGAGMVLKVAPIARAVEALKAQNEEVVTREVKSTDGSQPTTDNSTTRVVLLSAKGKRYTQEDARRLAGYEQLILVCGRYEGVDERVAAHVADEELSIGDYVLTGGELGAMVIVDSVVRLLPGVLGNEASSVDESHSVPGYREYPQYTKPAVWEGHEVPAVLLSGDHAAVARWRRDTAAGSPPLMSDTI